MKRLTAQTNTFFFFFFSNKYRKIQNLKENCTGNRMVNSDRTKAMHILQATYTHIRYFLVTKLHYARNVPHTYRRYPEKVATVKNSLEVGGGGGGESNCR